VNKQLTGTATWSKTADDGHPLQGSVWTLTFPDGHTQDITGDKQGRFSAGNLPWGQFTLVEKEAPAGYKVDDTKRTFTIDATHLNVSAIDSQSGVAVNAKQDVPGLPMTGGTSTDMFMIFGAALLILAAAFGGWYVLSNRRHARHQSGARH
jgi:trimeric autotransporter adhesin